MVGEQTKTTAKDIWLIITIQNEAGNIIRFPE